MSARLCAVRFAYAPQHEDELLLAEGDVVEVLEEVEEGWWKGRLRGEVRGRVGERLRAHDVRVV